MKRYFLLAGLVSFGFLGAALNGCSSSPGGVQGWSDAERTRWYRETQGSRLMPDSWFRAIEQAGSDAPFASMAHLERYGFIAPPESVGGALPIGFAVDRQDETRLSISNLTWFEGQLHGNDNAEGWIGLNCAACHTAQITYQGRTQIIDGGPNLLDFQSFVEDLDAAMAATRRDPAKWERFAARVLEGKDTGENRALLEAAFDQLLAWQEKTDVMNETPLRYGYGRLDAVGHILNKILMFNGAPASEGNPADAPVSYPFLWDIWRQEQVQWNGVARNSRIKFPGDDFEYGALGRNTGEVLGVFGDLVVRPIDGTLDSFNGYESSVQAGNLIDLELILKDLAAPAWPDYFPPIDEEARARGQDLFAESCARCHLTPDMQKKGEPTERMLTFEEVLEKNPAEQTDIWMACNAWIYDGPAGPMAGATDPDGNPVPEEGPVVNMLATAVKGSLLGKKREIISAGFRNFFGIRRQPDIFEAARDKEADREDCLLARDVEILAYKARPLDGIWATAPYLHNGSVASLYELLLPADERKAQFTVGGREFDPRVVGYAAEQPGQSFTLRTRGSNGAPIDGNSNLGHEYGAAGFSDQDRWDLVEYMKSL